jgi:hypothetical protein
VFRAIDPERWERVAENPVRLLQETPADRLAAAAADSALLERAAALDLGDDLGLRPLLSRLASGQAFRRLLRVLEPHGEMEPVCVRRSPGKEDGCNLKPFIAFQRVRLPPGKGRSPPAGSKPCMEGGNAAREA